MMLTSTVEWHDPETEMPDPGDIVIVYHWDNRTKYDITRMSPAKFENDRYRSLKDGSQLEAVSWCYLPTPPQEGA